MQKFSNYWKKFYDSGASGVPRGNSLFAAYVSKRIGEKSKIVEFGAGTGRDASFFARLGHHVIAVDKNTHAEGDFFSITCDAEDFPDVPCDLVYTRFFLHAVDGDTEDHVISYASRFAREIFIEARSDSAREDFNYVFGDHYRRMINLDALVGKLKRADFCIKEAKDSKGFAVYKGEDPPCVRVWAKNKTICGAS